jgi:phosphoenolpyruvate carboxylase
MKVPSIMSTQHPDCAFLPEWVKGEKITNSDEIKEALFAFRLGCDEQLWDWEGKDVDTHVIKKLLVLDGDYFKQNVFGEDIFITYRVPNPDLEGTEKKILVEALESIPKSTDVARKFYGREVNPIFEVAIPMTSSHMQMLRVASFYEKVIVGREDMDFHPDVEKLDVKSWLGETFPKTIQIIPLVEDAPAMLRIDDILDRFIAKRKPKYMRPWLARSDPALNYGNVPCVLMIKAAVSRIEEVENRTGVSMYPILATGSLPFRGHLRPDNIDNFLKEYIGFRTFAFQSSMKYDFPEKDVKGTVRKIRGRKMRKAEIPADEVKQLEKVIGIFSGEYRKTIRAMAPAINEVSRYVPGRRTRNLHIGLFGYSRDMGDGVRLPRAIKFTASLYSFGIPPEVVGMRSLVMIEKEGLKDAMLKYYRHFRDDLSFAARYVCEANIDGMVDKRLISEKVSMDLKEDLEIVKSLDIKVGPANLDDENHALLSKMVLEGLGKMPAAEMRDTIVKAARIRRSLG